MKDQFTVACAQDDVPAMLQLLDEGLTDLSYDDNFALKTAVANNAIGAIKIILQDTNVLILERDRGFPISRAAITNKNIFGSYILSAVLRMDRNAADLQLINAAIVLRQKYEIGEAFSTNTMPVVTFRSTFASAGIEAKLEQRRCLPRFNCF